MKALGFVEKFISLKEVEDEDLKQDLYLVALENQSDTYEQLYCKLLEYYNKHLEKIAIKEKEISISYAAEKCCNNCINDVLSALYLHQLLDGFTQDEKIIISCICEDDDDYLKYYLKKYFKNGDINKNITDDDIAGVKRNVLLKLRKWV